MTSSQRDKLPEGIGNDPYCYCVCHSPVSSRAWCEHCRGINIVGKAHGIVRSQRDEELLQYIAQGYAINRVENGTTAGVDREMEIAEWTDYAMSAITLDCSHVEIALLDELEETFSHRWKPSKIRDSTEMKCDKCGEWTFDVDNDGFCDTYNFKHLIHVKREALTARLEALKKEKK